MVDNYKAEVNKDGEFICYISRKTLNYVKECGLDFKKTPHSERLLISYSELKNAYKNAGEIADKIEAGTEKWFLCYFKHCEYLTKDELALEFKFKVDSIDKTISVSNDAYMEAVEECSVNKNNYVNSKKKWK